MPGSAAKAADVVITNDCDPLTVVTDSRITQGAPAATGACPSAE